MGGAGLERGGLFDDVDQIGAAAISLCFFFLLCLDDTSLYIVSMITRLSEDAFARCYAH